ncbi:hypothetical protein ACRVX5_12030 [Clostridioides difficile]|uniref:hypothetical protein n=1 Tax=Clostridioides TaxID=1870884 RepID=UPI001C18C9DA|nr:hypothetical protein [Clostridioides difficile]MCC0642540.1 hypothetical protein [Clostridioides sp. ES-S-0049-03]MCC0678481.1 hypothetical protein [Clostridioides sp. ES-W-0018-02]MCC0705224.1 hypothetical protein [Clostridioides sp. ES-S-0049-02]MCC0713324.1 hypothetical protein [Clostridioides sp. ES-W-0017-02]KAK2245335.1 hypothetical protein XC29_00410 [Clostridioides difficile]
MNIPKQVKVGGLSYKIEETEEPILINNQLCYGSADYGNEVIKLSSSLQSQRVKKITFLHELFHCIFNDRCIESEDEEYLVDVLAKGLYQVVTDNPEIFECKKKVNCNPITYPSIPPDKLESIELRGM